jgi:hypothetical protein
MFYLLEIGTFVFVMIAATYLLGSKSKPIPIATKTSVEPSRIALTRATDSGIQWANYMLPIRGPPRWHFYDLENTAKTLLKTAY